MWVAGSSFLHKFIILNNFTLFAIKVSISLFLSIFLFWNFKNFVRSFIHPYILKYNRQRTVTFTTFPFFFSVCESGMLIKQ